MNVLTQAMVPLKRHPTKKKQEAKFLFNPIPKKKKKGRNNLITPHKFHSTVKVSAKFEKLIKSLDVF